MAPGSSLSPNDAMWLNMDTPENLMVIETVMWFDQQVSPARIRAVLQERMVSRYPVFTWHPQASTTPLRFDHWVPTPDFRLADHVTTHRLRGADEQAALRRFVSRQMSVPLDKNRPLWHAHVINGEHMGALMLRLHHAIADGAALVQVLMDLTDGESDVIGGRSAPGMVRPRDAQPGNSLVVAHGRSRLSLLDPLGLVRRGQTVLGGTLAALRDPVMPAAAALGEAERTLARVGGVADAVDNLVLSHRPHNSLSTPAGGTKKADWSQPLPLADLKLLAKREGATVNDVLLAGLAGGLRRYCQSRGESPENLVTMVPVNLRPPNEKLPPHLGNQFALVALELPLAAATTRGRLTAGKLRMDVIKRGPQALLTYGVSHAVGTVGSVNQGLSRRLIDFFSNKAVGVTTNVIGPRERRWMAGAEMVGVLGWVPTAGEQSLGVCIFSYNNQVWVGFKADTAAVPDVHELTVAFEEAMTELVELS